MHCMIDIETIDTKPSAVVLSIGAVMFDKYQLGNTFYQVLDVPSQKLHGRTENKETLDWWNKQNKEAYDAVFNCDETEKVSTTLTRFSDFFLENIAQYPWGNGSTFDISIMEDLYRMAGQIPPWDFRYIMDMRTFMHFNYKGSKPRREGVYHNALDDAIYQAKLVMKGMSEMSTQREMFDCLL